MHFLSVHDNGYCVFDCVSIASSQTPLVAPHEESVPTGSFVVIERSDLHIGDMSKAGLLASPQHHTLSWSCDAST